MAVLVEIRGDQRREFGLREINTLGRASCNHVQVDDPLVSRCHAEIRRLRDGRFEIVDLGSTHGTFVKKDRISERVLEDNDEIVVGATRYLFRQRSESDSMRRWDERIACDLPVCVKLAGGRKIGARTTDISLSGIHLHLDEPLDGNTVVTLRISFPQRKRPVRVKARVTHASDGADGVGVAFLLGSRREHRVLVEQFALLLRGSPPEGR